MPEQTFLSWLDYLEDNRWTIVGLPQLVAALEGAPLPQRAALITFDDGYAATGETVLRCLGSRGLDGVVFVPTDHVGRANAFEADTDEPPEAICDWALLARLEEAGVSVESHGASHRAFSELASEELDHELRCSKTILERRLAKQVTALAYPYGDAGNGSPAAVKDFGYRVAFEYGGGPFRPDSVDCFRIPRLAMGPETDIERELAGA